MNILNPLKHQQSHSAVKLTLMMTGTILCQKKKNHTLVVLIMDHFQSLLVLRLLMNNIAFCTLKWDNLSGAN